ncbi:hypothetical protein C8R45DRAFT_30928 [Mycena sanguinolenta]|nr:hypothetical protein C8R45DRAFT_30928 [Mycena sanguinolenta]
MESQCDRLPRTLPFYCPQFHNTLPPISTMPLWSVLAPLNLGQWLCPHTPIAPPPARRRKSKLAKSYKPAPLVTPFQKYRKQELAQLVSEASESSESEYSQYSDDSGSSFSLSSSSSSSTPTEEPTENTPPDNYFDQPPIPEHIRLQLEFAKLRVRPHLNGGRPLERDVFDHPLVRRRLELQQQHDQQSLDLPPTQARVFYNNPLALAPSPFPAAPAPPVARQYVVQRWHGLKKEAEAVKEDRQAYRQIRARREPSPVLDWR